MKLLAKITVVFFGISLMASDPGFNLETNAFQLVQSAEARGRGIVYRGAPRQNQVQRAGRAFTRYNGAPRRIGRDRPARRGR